MVIQHGRIEGKSRKDSHEQNETCQAQSRMRDAMKEPAKRCTLQGPPHPVIHCRSNWIGKISVMKNSAAPPKSASCALRAGLVSDVRLSTTRSPRSEGRANARGTRPGIWLG